MVYRRGWSDIACGGEGVWRWCILCSSESIYMSSLTDLNLTYDDILVYVARALANSELLGRLMHVDLLFNKIEAEGLQALRQSQLLNGYRNLEMKLVPQSSVCRYDF